MRFAFFFFFFVFRVFKNFSQKKNSEMPLEKNDSLTKKKKFSSSSSKIYLKEV